jgi:hypothetical protein
VFISAFFHSAPNKGILSSIEMGVLRVAESSVHSMVLPPLSRSLISSSNYGAKIGARRNWAAKLWRNPSALEIRRVQALLNVLSAFGQVENRDSMRCRSDSVVDDQYFCIVQKKESMRPELRTTMSDSASSLAARDPFPPGKRQWTIRRSVPHVSTSNNLQASS